MTVAGPAWRQAQWLDGWRAFEPVPVGAAELDANIADTERALVPATVEEVAVMLDGTVALYDKLPANWDEISGFYFEALEDVPLDLVAKALKHVRLTCKWFPKPSELRDPIVDELARRKTALLRLHMAKGFLKPPAPVRKGPLSAETEKALAAVKAHLRLVPKDPTDTERPTGTAGAEIATFRLPDDDDPAVQRTLRDMGRAE